MRDNFFRRLALPVLAVGFVVTAVVPQAAAQESRGEGEGEPKQEVLCDDGKAPDDTGSCARDTTPQRCPDGSEPKEGTCPEPQTNPCPDGADFCEQIRSCPVGGPLPQGSTCEDLQTTTTTSPPPVPPAAAPGGDGNVLGRPTVEGVTVDAPPAPPAPSPAVPAPAAPSRGSREPLARTGSMEAWLTALGSSLIALGVTLRRLAERPAAFVRHA